MTTSSATDKGSGWVWQPRGAAGWLGLAASPTFALMAWIATNACTADRPLHLGFRACRRPTA